MSEIRVDTISEKTSGSGTTVSNLVNPNSPFRNVIINGDMHIWQRTTAATAMGNGAYSTVDRWVMYEGTDGAVTTEQSALSVADKGTTGCANALLAKCTTADTSIAAGQYVIIEQRIEAQYLQHLGYGTSSAKSLTVSFWVKAYVAGTYNVALRKQDSTAYYISQEYTVDSSNTWEYKTLTFSPTAGSTSLITSANGVINNDSGEGIRLDFQLTLGSNFHATTNTWNSSIAGIGSSNQTNFVSSTDNTFYLTGVQLEVGSTATDFEHLPRDVNLQRCQRYFYNLSSLGPYVPASEAAYLGAGFYYTSSFVIAMINLPTAMRTEPSLTTSNASNSFMFYRNGEGDNMDDLSLNGSSSAICVTVGNNSDVSGTAGMGGGLVVQAGTICNLSAEI